ncbi:MAG: hypothetical protein NTX90_01810 [Alphaproteobacteria bacterium]|nr:hypothetical protein [Alphaproteobacteria bacterium]
MSLQSLREYRLQLQSWCEQRKLAVMIAIMAFVIVLLSIILSADLLPWFLGLVELLKGISWPLSLILILYMFRRDLGDLLGRVREAGPSGATFDPKPLQQEQKRVASDIERNREHPEVMLETGTINSDEASFGVEKETQGAPIQSVSSGDTEPPKSLEEIKLKDLPGMSRSVEQANLERLLLFGLRTKSEIPDDLQVDFLIKLLAEARLGLHFERIYRIIFGSQLRGLRRLYEKGSVTVGDARQYFNSIVSDNPAFYTEESFGSWLDFLLRAGLVRKVGLHLDSDGTHLQMTSFGEDFLRYVHEQRYTDDLPR